MSTKKEQAARIFNEELINRKNGAFASNKDFRARVLDRLKTEMFASVASAATMYNDAKKAAESADPSIGLGRDPNVTKTTIVKASGIKRKPKVVAQPEVTSEVLVEKKDEVIESSADDAFAAMGINLSPINEGIID